jgi:GT2 family glycosyltransferase
VPWEVIVVDDGSTDDTVSVVARWSQFYPHIRLIANLPPHRFSSACNRGATAACGTYLLFLNNDIEVLSGWFQPLFTILSKRPEVGIAAAKLFFPDGTIQHCGKVLRRDSNGLLVFEHLLYEQPDGTPASVGGEFLTVTGACLLVRSNEFYRYGPFDERYVNGWEDDDLCLSFYRQGLRAAVCADSTMIHHQGGTLKAEAALIERYLAVMRDKGIKLAPDDPLLVSLSSRVKAGSESFSHAYVQNRGLFYHKWLPLLEQLYEAAHVTKQLPDNRVTIIIVTYNSEGTIRACLESVLATLRPGDLALVVDNASKDQTVTITESYGQRDTRLACHQNRENRGYGAAINQGLDRSLTPFVVFLNPDTVVTSGWLDRLLQHCADPKVAAIGPVSNYAAAGQSVDRHWQGTLPTGISPEQAATLLYGWNFGTALPTNLLIGFCLLIRRELLMELGGMDERLFIGNDDLELSWRLKSHGYELLIARDVFVYHEGQHSFRTEAAGTTNHYLQDSSDAFYRILEDHYGPERVPEPQQLWGVDWFRPTQGRFNPSTQKYQVLILPRAVRLPAPSSLPLVSVVILTFNQLPYTLECIEALLKHTPQSLQIILVDNGSTDGTVSWLQAFAAQDARVCLILNSENRGFAAGSNQGIEKALGRYVVLLNNDVLVTPEWLTGLLECHTAVPNAGIVGPMTNSASGIQVIETPNYAAAGGIDQFAHQFRSQHRFRRVSSRRIVGFCMLFEQTLSASIGLLDESFGTGNYEDDDYCLRSAIAGYRNLIAGDVFVHHYGGISFGGAGIDYRSSLATNSRLFREKWSRPVTDRAVGERITICRAREDLEDLLLGERESEAVDLLDRFGREFPARSELRTFCGDLKATSTLEGCHDDPASGLACLERAKRAEQHGEHEYSNALIMKGFMLEPWRPALIQALQGLAENGVYGLSILVEEAVRLFPASRGLARLRVKISVENPETALAAAERFLRYFGPDDEIIERGIRLRRTQGAYHRPALSGHAVTLCMIVRNEEHCLARCLASCLPVVDEVVVVDTGSDDRTRLIAELFGAYVVEQPWNGDFSAARNASLAAATADWLLVMDADEVLSARDREMFSQVLATTATLAAFQMTTRNYTNQASVDGFVPCSGEYPEDESGAGWTTSTKIRLFPNHRKICFEGVVHELVETSVVRAGIPVVTHPVVVHHYGGLEDARLQRKREFYYVLGLEKLHAGAGDDLKALYELAIQAAELKRFEEAEGLWRRFLENKMHYAPAWSNFGYVLLRRGVLDEAGVAIERALEIQPEYHAAHINRALCAFCRLSVDQAERIIRFELNRSSDDISLRILIELCRLDADNVEAVTAGLRQIIAEGYHVSTFIAETAEVLERIGEREKAHNLHRLLIIIST